MWPFTNRAGVRALRNEVAELRRDMEQTCADLVKLKAHHLSLRGAFYARLGTPLGDGLGAGSSTAIGARRGAGGSRGAPSGQQLTKDELRRLAGIKPGRPYPHRDDGQSFDLTDEEQHE